MRCVLSLVMRVMLNQTIAVRLSCISVELAPKHTKVIAAGVSVPSFGY